MLKQKRAKELDLFYDFAYKCDDDYDIMAKVIKMHVKEKYCIIKAHLELTNITNYLNAMRKASSCDIECAITGAKGFLHAHHIENFSTHKDKRMDVTNGIPLLKEIHEHFHSVYGKNKNSMKQLFDYAKEYHGIDTIKINGEEVSWNDYKLQK